MGEIKQTRDQRGCVRLTLDNPPRRNAIDSAMMDRLSEVLSDLAADSGCRLLVIAGAGDHFCAGRDLTGVDIDTLSDTDLRLEFSRVRRLAELFEAFPRPVISVARGYALGLGAAILCWSDIAYAAQDAALGFPEVKVGIPPSFTALASILQVGRKAAAPLLLTGASINGAEAERIGLVSRALPGAELDQAIETLAAQIVAASPTALVLCKDLLRSIEGKNRPDALDLVLDATVHAARTDDAREGRNAFKQKRVPQWREI